MTANVTMVDQTSGGYVSVGPDLDGSPSTSTLNAPLGDVRANGVTVALDGDGQLTGVFKGQRGPNYPSYDSRYHNAWELLVAIRDAGGRPSGHRRRVPGRQELPGPDDLGGQGLATTSTTDENEPEVLLDALHHAREHLTIEQILDTFTQLTLALRRRTAGSPTSSTAARSGSSSRSTRTAGRTT